ncbi:MAG: toxin YoeB [Verrucomicrobiales bacterium]|jgi:toxin YoeB
MRLELKPEAFDDIREWTAKEPRKLKRVWDLIEATLRNPFQGPGKPEPLKGDLSGCWSRRIDQKNRLVYQVDDDTLIIIQCKGHYGDH